MRARPLPNSARSSGSRRRPFTTGSSGSSSAGTSSISAQLDAKRLGLELTAFVSCYTTPDCKYDEFTRALGDMPEVCEVHSVAGEETFVCKVVTRSTQHLDDLLARLKGMPGMARTRTTIVLTTPYDRGGITVQS